MSVIGSLNAVLSIDNSPFNSGLSKSGKSIDAFKAKADGLGAFMSGLGARLAPVAVVAGVASIVKSTFHHIDAQTELAESLQLSVTSLGRLQYAAIQSGVEIDQLSTAVSQLEMRLGKGSSKGALDKLGLSPEKLKALSPDQALLAISDAFGKVTVPAERAAIATEIFGKSGAKLLPFLAQGRDRLLEFGDAAEKTGSALSELSAGKVGEADAAFNRLGESWQGLKNTATVALAPALTLVADGLNSILDLSRRSHQVTSQLTASMIGGLAGAFAKFGAKVQGLYRILGITDGTWEAGFDAFAENIIPRSNDMFADALGVPNTFSDPTKNPAPDARKSLTQEDALKGLASAFGSPLAQQFKDAGAAAKASLGGALDTIISKAGPASDKFHKFLEDLQKAKQEADELTGSLANPLETFQDGLAKLEDQLAHGLITRDIFGRGVAQLADGLAGSVGTDNRRVAAISRGSQEAFSAIAQFERGVSKPKVEDLLKAAGDIQAKQLAKQDEIVKELKRIGLVTVQF